MRLPEIVGTERRVSEVVRQRIPGHRTGDGERPTAERATTMSWYDEMVAARRSKSLTTASSIEPVARSLRRKSSKPRLLQFLFGNLLVNRHTSLIPTSFDYNFIFFCHCQSRMSSVNNDVLLRHYKNAVKINK